MANNLKFGDIVRNGWASNSNPTKILMFVRETKAGRRQKRVAVCLAADGTEFIHLLDDNQMLTKIGRVDFTDWIEKATRQLEKANGQAINPAP